MDQNELVMVTVSVVVPWTVHDQIKSKMQAAAVGCAISETPDAHQARVYNSDVRDITEGEYKIFKRGNHG
jgi:hypothetical protein